MSREAPAAPQASSPPSPRVLLAVSLLAGATLGVQVALTRHFSFLYWHHFAFMIIGVGMLGFGAAGAWLARRGGMEAGPQTEVAASRSAVAAGSALLLYLFLGPHLSFEPLELLADPGQFFVLLVLYLFIFVVFTALGLAQGSLLAGYRTWAHRVYAVDLLGAGLGCLLTLALLSLVSAPASLLFWGAVAALAGGLLGGRVGSRAGVAGWLLCALLVLLLGRGWADERPFVPAASKDMSEIYREAGGNGPGPVIEHTVSSPTIRLDVTRPVKAPFMFGGSVSREWSQVLVPTRIVYQDAAAPTYLYGLDDPETASFLGGTNQSLAYQIRPQPRVLVIGAGGGPDVMIALHHRAREVTAVELNPQMMALGLDRYAEFTRGLYHRSNVIPVVSEGRHFLGRNREKFDIVQMSGVDTFAALSSGAYVLSEDYLYTVEAGLAILGALGPDGLLSSSRWYLYPPRETLRLVNTLIESLRLDGAREPERHVFVVEAGAWATTLVSRRPFSEQELAVLRAWVADRGWLVVLDPSGEGSPPFVRLVHRSSAERQAYADAYPYDLSPATDDRPFFFQFYKWRHLFEAPESRGGYSITRVPVGHAVLAASLLQMTALGAVCILGPLWSQRSRLRGERHLTRHFTFFAALGFGFMAIEITTIQAFTVFLGHPIYSMAIILASLLVATGLGSFWAGRYKGSPETVVRAAVLSLLAWVGATVLLLGPVLPAAIGWSLPLRGLLTAAWLVPAGLALGMPFPTAIRAIREEAPALVPWAWGTNACLSVFSSLLSVLLAMSVGFRWTLGIAALTYAGGYMLWRGTLGENPSHGGAR